MADAAMALGAAGIVLGICNADLHSACASTVARPPSCTSRPDSVVDLGRIGFTAGAQGAFTEALHLSGVIADARPALLPLDMRERPAIVAILDEAGLGVTVAT